MRKLPIALGLSSFLALAGATLMAPTIASAADEVSYTACNSSGDCWRFKAGPVSDADMSAPAGARSQILPQMRLANDSLKRIDL